MSKNAKHNFGLSMFSPPPKIIKDVEQNSDDYDVEMDRLTHDSKLVDKPETKLERLYRAAKRWGLM